jgi:CheY-like chemotaxis protein
MPKILVAEDDLAFREPLVKMLTNDGHTVAVAGDGVETLKLLETFRPDLVLTDVLMPKMDGIELVMDLMRSGNAVPIIAMSGGRRSVTADFNLGSAEMVGAKLMLAKPFSRADLRRAIQQALALPRPG